VGPEHAALRAAGRARYESASDDEALVGFKDLASQEGILAALESSHALGWVRREREGLAGRSVLVNLSGRGDKDMATILEALAPESHGESS
jgi:tryptophan synthase beta chain